jgi:hypothetical protein
MGRRPGEEELVPLPVGERPQVAPAAGGPAPERPGLDLPGRAIGLGALLLGLVVAGALTGIDGDRRREASFTPPATVARPAPGAGDEAAPHGWRRGAPGPLRHRDFAAQVWTGTELVVWGGDPDGDSGAAYDPATDRWRAIAAAPIPARCEPATAWSGREVLVWGRACRLTPGPSPGRSRYATAGAAYDPATDRWRVLPTGPLTAGSPTMSVWTGSEWIIANPIGPTAALEPTSGRWRTLPPLPYPYALIVGQWTGREVVVLGTNVLEKGPSTGVGAAFRHWAAALDPAHDKWRTLPVPPLDLTATAVWDGHRLIAWDQNLEAVAIDPNGGTGWKRLPDVPVTFADCTPQGARLGDVVFAEECGQGAVFRPSSGTWERIPHPQSLAELPVWTGDDALFWVGRFDGSADGIWLYRP